MTNENARKLAHLFLEGRQQEAFHYINGFGEHRLLDILEDYFTPAMRYIGELWENNEITVADEHLATAVCDFVLSQYTAGRNKENSMNGRKAMFLCIEGEQHYLGLKMVNSLFEDQGWQTRYFGPNLPLEYSLKAAKDWKPDVIGLSVAIPYHLPLLKNYASELMGLLHKPDIFVGGRLVQNYDLSPYCPEGTYIFSGLPSLKKWLSEKRLGERIDALS